MTLLELIQTTPISDILRECERIDRKTGYDTVIEKLKRLQPKPADFTIIISPWQGGGGILHDVSGENHDGEAVALDFVAWDEMLGAEVRVSDLDLTPAQIVAQCLYEITFYAHDPEQIEELKDEIKRRGEEIVDGSWSKLDEIKRDEEDDQ